MNLDGRLTLKRASADFADAFVVLRDAFMAVGENEWEGGAVIAHTDPSAYLEILRSWSDGKNLPPNWAPADSYLIFVDDSVVGQLDVRHPLTEFLHQWGGHIGYHVHPGFRNRGIATWALRVALDILAAKGVPEALLTCGHDNAASIRVIEKCGGKRIADSTRRRYIIPTSSRPTLSFRALGSSDFPLLQRWLSATHVDEWWHQALDLAGVASKYTARIDGTEPTHVYIVSSESGPIGFIQWYRWLDYPEHAVQLGAGQLAAGVDLAIGEAALIGRGIGPQIIREFLGACVWPQPDITSVVADVDVRNARSLRAFEKAGFSRTTTIRLNSEDFDRHVLRLEAPSVGQSAIRS